MTFIITHRTRSFYCSIRLNATQCQSHAPMSHLVQLKIGMLICVLTGMLFGAAYYHTVNCPGKYSWYFHYPSVSRS